LYRWILYRLIITLTGISLLSMSSNSLSPFSIAEASSNSDDDLEDDEDFEEANSIKICCAWGVALEDGTLTYYIDDDESSEKQQQAVRNAVQEWDTKLESLELEEDSSKRGSDITIEFQNNIEEGGIAGETVTIFNADGFLDNAQITVFKGVEDYDFDTAIVGQVAKHEMGHALGLGHANFNGNLMAEMVNGGTATVSECETNAVTAANQWKLGDNRDGDVSPAYPQHDSVTC
jgi:hypothetical protein